MEQTDKFNIHIYVTRLRPQEKHCKQSYRVLCRHAEVRERMAVLRAPCRSWGCEACAAWMSYRLGKHYARRLLAHGKLLHLADIPLARWETTLRRLIRKDASYLWIGVGECRRLIATVNVRRPRDAWIVKSICPEGACEVMVDTLLAMPLRTKARRGLSAMDASRDWHVTPRDEKREWERVAFVHCVSPEPIVAFLEDCGIKADVRKTTGGFVVRFRLPDGIDESAATALIARLRTVR